MAKLLEQRMDQLEAAQLQRGADTTAEILGPAAAHCVLRRLASLALSLSAGLAEKDFS